MRSNRYESLNTVVVLPLTAGQQITVAHGDLNDLEGVGIGNGMFSYFSASLIFAQ